MMEEDPQISDYHEGDFKNERYDTPSGYIEGAETPQGEEITQELLRKRAEHNDCMLSNLEEVSLYFLSICVDFPPLAKLGQDFKT
jgi:hypothetical protein